MSEYIATTINPELTEDGLKLVEALIGFLPEGAIKSTMQKLLSLIHCWWQLPESDTEPVPHPTGVGQVIGLSPDVQNALDPYLPRTRILNTYAGLFDTIAEKDVREAAFHLLWYAKEFDAGREPLTIQKVRG